MIGNRLQIGTLPPVERCEIRLETFDRPYAGVADLRRMEGSLARAYGSTSLRVGDLSWLSRIHTHRELSLDIHLWEDASGQLIAWTYFRANGEFNAFVSPNTGHADDTTLFEELVGFVERASQMAIAAGDPPVTLNTYAIDVSRSPEDRSLAIALERFGYQVDRSATSDVLVRSVDQLPEPALPVGYHLDWVRTPALLVGRVEAHRAAFAPSDLSVRMYERVQRTWAYRANLDRVVVTDDGNVVAFCTAWFDELNRAGLLEPVGTHPVHQRRGLARAVSVDALRALRAEGARKAQVGFTTEAAYATYSSIGFERAGNEVVFFREPAV
jgi:ribosomal protein S18 acetylase RimI-like enzyme